MFPGLARQVRAPKESYSAKRSGLMQGAASSDIGSGCVDELCDGGDFG